jgi:hypothetical protein
VVDPKKIARLTELRNYWLSQFDVTKRNSVAAQLTSITWDITAFEVFREVANLSEDASDGGKRLNGLIFNLLARSFYKGFMSDVRKLNDDRRDTNSLRQLLKSLKKNSALLTRENVFACEGIPYDWVPIADAERAAMEEQFRCGQTFALGPDYIGSSDHSISRHRQLDQLCDVLDTSRQPSDVVPKRLFQSLIDHLQRTCSDIKTYVDHHIAHAATESKLANVALVNLTHSDLMTAHQELCRIAGFISLTFLVVRNLRFSCIHLATHLIISLNRY